MNPRYTIKLGCRIAFSHCLQLRGSRGLCKVCQRQKGKRCMIALISNAILSWLQSQHYQTKLVYGQ